MYLLYTDNEKTLKQNSALFEKHLEPLLKRMDTANAAGDGTNLSPPISAHLPVIASSNNGAPGFIEHERHGRIYEHGTDESLATELDWMLCHPKEVAEMSRHAFDLSKNWTWKHYRNKYALSISEKMCSDPVGR